MSSNTPSRISLRRKRLNNEFRQANPSPKRMSPSTENEANDGKGTEQSKVNSLKHNNGATNLTSSIFLTPKGCRRRDKKTTNTPTTSKKSTKRDSDGIEEFSPSQSFLCSQISSTQDCEVVWDCNSPGYTKDELKRMGGESCDKTSPLSSAPSRLLFTSKYKRPLPPSSSSVRFPSRVGGKDSEIVAAELDCLLTKVNCERVKEMSDLNEEKEQFSIDEVLNFLNEPTQPVSFPEPQTKKVGEEDTFTKPMKLMQRETAMRRVSDNATLSDVKDNIVAHVDDYNERSACPSLSSSIEESLNKEKEAVMSMSFSSMEDDDLFNESVLRSTQALEEAILNEEAPKVTKTRVSPLSRIRKRTPVRLKDDLCNEIKSVNNCVTSDQTNNNQFKSSFPFGTKEPHSSLSAIEEKSSSVTGSNLKINTRNFQMKSSVCTDDSKISFLKPIKPRATFQLEKPNERSLRDLFDTKFCNSPNVERNRSVDDCCLALKSKVTEKEKMSRSKSETTHGSKSPIQHTSYMLQESDEDDEIFASLMPALIAAEEEHSKKFSSDPIHSSSVTKIATNVHGSSIESTTNIADQHQKPSMNNTDNNKKSSLNITDHHQNLKFNNLSHHQKLPTIIIDHQEPLRSRLPADSIKNKDIGKILFPNSKFKETKTFHLVSQTTANGKVSTNNKANKMPISSGPNILAEVGQAGSSRKAKHKGSNFDDDDDDDIFLQDGVLDYISFVESQYVSSESPNENTSPASIDSVSSFLEPRSSAQPPRTRSTSTRPLGGPVTEVGEQHFAHSKDKKKQIEDVGSHFLKKELLKVGQTTALLNRVLQGETSIALNDNLRATGSSAASSGKAPNPHIQNERKAFQSANASYVRPAFAKRKEDSELGSKVALGENWRLRSSFKK